MTRENIFNKKQTHDKDWRHAFLENGIIEEKNILNNYICGISNCDKATKYSIISAYVSQFETGGFFLNENGLFFTTDEISSDEDATYEDALEFIKNWKERFEK